MKIIRKISAISLCLVILFSLVSCGQTGEIGVTKDGKASVTVETVYDKSQFDEEVKKIKNGENYTLSTGQVLTAENIDEYVAEFKEYYEIKTINGKECYYYGFSKDYKSLKALEAGFYSTYMVDPEIPILFDTVKINENEAFFYKDTSYKQLVFPGEERTLKFTLPKKITKTNGEKIGDYEVKFDLLNGSEYRYYVCEGSAIQNSEEKEILEFCKNGIIEANKPKKVTNLLIKFTEKNTVKLSFFAPETTLSYEEKVFEIQRKVGNGKWKTVSVSKTESATNKVSGGKTYSYRVRTRIKYLGKYSYGEYSNVKTIKTMNFTQKPVVRKTKVGKKNVTVSLKSKIKNANGYQYLVATNKKMTKYKKSTFSKSTKLTIRKLKSGKKYFIKVRAYKTNANGEKVYGAWSKITASKKIK